VGHVAHLIANLITGVTDGFTASLRSTASVIVPQLQGKNLQLNARLQPRCCLSDPRGHRDQAPKPTEIVLNGIDKQRVGQVAAEIRAWRPPEPYKGKGVKYAEERSSAKKARRSNGI
jgi:large subunit ribosomal protein L6